ncbi:hypothetical protein [Spongiimicrobium sp. 2-473A-2-J]|uniref:hypothetical protein n=1 Tax=Eudoraea algarum TaxID=3417568 RepID=UPI003D35CF65
MKYPILFCGLMLGALLCCSCANQKAQRQEAAITFPELGSMVKLKGKLLHTQMQQIGTPQLQAPLKLTVQQLPFNSASYTTYSTYIKKAGQVNSIAYDDSLPYKPKYLRLQLLDRIGLVQLLNSEANTQVRNYLENDPDYRMVVSLDVTMQDALMPQFLEAGNVLLQQNGHGEMFLVLENGKQQQPLDFSQVQVFNYGTASFCWGEDQFNKMKIEAILSFKESCPQGTHKKAAKASGDREYLKFK